MMLLQAITIADQAFEKHKKEVDFIKRYIFPEAASLCHSHGDALAKATDLRLIHLEESLHTMSERSEHGGTLFDNIQQVRALGYSETFIRMWNSIYATARQDSGSYLGDVQMLFAKPLWKGNLLCRPLLMQASKK